MKVALVHDYIKEYGGAEQVLETLHEIFPDAEVFTTVYCPSFLGPHRKRFENWNIKTSWLQYIPFKHKLISPFRLITPLIFKQFDFSGYDVVIVSATGAYSPNGIRSKGRRAKGVKNFKQLALSSKPIHICYCHTPPRYLYGYPTARDWKSNPLSLIIGTIVNHFLRLVDYTSAQNVDYFIVNSEEVKGRIQKFYRKDATVMYPPVEVKIPNPKFQIPNNSQNAKYKMPNTKYYLTGSRLARAKHIDLLIKTANKYKLPLKVFGRGFAGYEDELHELAYGVGQRAEGRSTIEFLGEVTQEEKYELMRGAKAFLFASEYEDFGIVPVEAMGQGIPVVAYKSGGVKETVVDGKTGVFFDELSVESCYNAIERLGKTKIDSQDCKKQAERFNSERFKKEIKKFIENTNI